MIKFKTIRWKNFLSTGAQFTEVGLDKSTTTLVVGENGAGKSTILDALCFVLFNKPFRSINKPQLLNTINAKNLLVELEFNIGPKEYKIVRGIKPGIFEIHVQNVLLNQDAAAKDYQKYLEDTILKLNYKSFTQIVILGSASFTPFMQLPLGHRREIIEDILDIQIFTVMNSVLKNKQTEIKNSILDIDSKVEFGKSKVKLQQDYIKNLEDDIQKRAKDTTVLIETANTAITGFTTEINTLKSQVDGLKLTILDDDETKKKEKQILKVLDKLKEKSKKVNSDITFYLNHDDCPTCNQNLSEDFKDKTITEHKHKSSEVADAIHDLENQIKDVDLRLEQIDIVKTKIAELNESIINFSSSLIAEQNYIKKLAKEIQDGATNTTNIDEEKTKLKALAKDVILLSEEKGKQTEEKHYFEIAGILLKDTGIKTKIIRQYLPIINKLVNKYLVAMDFFCHFELDETFNETIKSRHRDEFSYASFSEGEKQRIDLALLFTWRTIAKMKNCASTNLLLLDEVFDSSLDANGTDYVMNLINTLGDETNVFVISHKGDLLFDKFRSVIKFEKHQNFSIIQGI